MSCFCYSTSGPLCVVVIAQASHKSSGVTGGVFSTGVGASIRQADFAVPEIIFSLEGLVCLNPTYATSSHYIFSPYLIGAAQTCGQRDYAFPGICGQPPRLGVRPNVFFIAGNMVD